MLRFIFGGITVPTHGFLSLIKIRPSGGFFNEHTRYTQCAVQTNVALALCQTYLAILLNLRTLFRTIKDGKQ